MNDKITKIEKTIERLKSRLEKFESGDYYKKYQKIYSTSVDSPKVIMPIVGDKNECMLSANVDWSVRIEEWRYWHDCDHADCIWQYNANLIKLDQAKQIAERKQNKQTSKKLKDQSADQIHIIKDLSADLIDYRKELFETFKQRLQDRRDYIQSLKDRCRTLDNGAKFELVSIEEWESLRNASDEDIIDIANDNADHIIQCIVRRLSKTIGEIDHFENKKNSHMLLDTEAIAKSGKKVSIKVMAVGGYNIKRYHYRVRIKEL